MKKIQIEHLEVILDPLPTLKLYIVNENSLKVFEMNNVRARLGCLFFSFFLFRIISVFGGCFLGTQIIGNKQYTAWTVKSSTEHY